MSWDPLYVSGLRTPRNDSFLAKLPQIPVWLVNPSRWLVPPVLDSEAFEKRLIVDGNRNGSRSVRSDDGGGKLHARALIGGRAHGLLSPRLVVYPALSDSSADPTSHFFLCEHQLESAKKRMNSVLDETLEGLHREYQ